MSQSTLLPTLLTSFSTCSEVELLYNAFQCTHWNCGMIKNYMQPWESHVVPPEPRQDSSEPCHQVTNSNWEGIEGIIVGTNPCMGHGEATKDSVTFDAGHMKTWMHKECNCCHGWFHQSVTVSHMSPVHLPTTNKTYQWLRSQQMWWF